MAKAGTVETYFEDGQWHVEVGGDAGPRQSFDPKDEAVEAGKELAKQLKAEHVIKNKDGTIAEKNSYGNDPFPPKG